MPESGLAIIGEHFQRVNHHLLALPGATLEGLKTVRSHVHALSQCRTLIRALGLKPLVAADTAGAAAEIAAARRYQRGRDRLGARRQDLRPASRSRRTSRTRSTTPRASSSWRATPRPLPPDGGKAITTFVFRVRNVPAALYKAMGGFATNGVNMTKLESYMLGGRFTATQFYADVEGHPEDRPLALALEELRFFSREVTILGTYPAHPFRDESTQSGDRLSPSRGESSLTSD